MLTFVSTLVIGVELRVLEGIGMLDRLIVPFKLHFDRNFHNHNLSISQTKAHSSAQQKLCVGLTILDDSPSIPLLGLYKLFHYC